MYIMCYVYKGPVECVYKCLLQSVITTVTVSCVFCTFPEFLPVFPLSQHIPVSTLP